MANETFYPSLSTLVSAAALPPSLGVVQGLAEGLLEKVFYRNLQTHRSRYGERAHASLILVTYGRIGVEIPGTGLALYLNPSLSTAASEIPVSFSYRWELLRYVHDFDLSQFDYSPRAFFDLVLLIARINYQELINEVVATFIGGTVDDFVSRFNAAHPANAIAVTPDADVATYIERIVDALDAESLDVLDVLFEDYILAADVSTSLANVEKLFRRRLDFFSKERIEQLLVPQVAASLGPLSVGVQFPALVLREVDDKGEPLPDPFNPGSDKPTLLRFDVASLRYSTANGLDFDLAESLELEFPRSEILRTGLILEAHGVKVDFSRTTNIPEATADGRPADFVGVYVKDATITFPAFWNPDPNSTGVIKGRGLVFGTGGVSGTLALEAVVANHPSPVVNVRFGDSFSLGLDKFRLTLKHNAILDSAIEGTLIIPGLEDSNGDPAMVRVKVAIRQDGDFDVSAHEDDGFEPIGVLGVFDLTVKSLFMGKKDDDFYLGIAGSILFTHPLLAGIAKSPIEIEKLIVWSDGRFEIEGGTIPLPENIRFPIGPAELSISAIHLGSSQRVNDDGTTTNFRSFGFDGAIDVNPGGVDVRGNGITFYFPVNGDLSLCYLEIKSIAVDLVIPGSASRESATLLVSGYLSVGGTAGAPEYEGGVSFALPDMRIAGGAAMKYRPKTPAFLVDAFVELAVPIPLGATSLGIFGFRGLFGLRYVATKKAAQLDDTKTWFDYYKVERGSPPAEGVSVAKFEPPEQTGGHDSAFSIGAGVSLATIQDSGKTLSCKLFLLLSLPDLIYLEGKANILGERVGLTGEDPMFFALLAISSQSVETGVGVTYQLPRDGAKKGQILDLSAEMRAAFFFRNSRAWYVNLGTIQHPTTARVLTLFDATAYLMLSAAGIAAGAGVTYGFAKSYAGGMVSASVRAYITVGGFISFQGPQIGGFAMLGGHVDVSLMWLSFYIVIDTSLSVEVPRPFYVQGSVHLCVGITIGFWKFKKRIDKCFDVAFRWEKDTSVDTTPVLPFQDPSVGALPPFSATNMLSGETFDIASFGTSLPSPLDARFDAAVLPLDTWVDIEFLKGLLPSPNVDARIGRLSGAAPANAVDYVPPAEVAHKVKHQYSITALQVLAWNGTAWVDYRPYEAMSPPDALAVLAANPSAYKDGFWMNTGDGFNKIRLLAETSLSYMQLGQPGWYVPEEMGITSATLFCRTKLRDEHCIAWAGIAPDTVYADGTWQQMDRVLYRVTNGAGRVVAWNGPAGAQRVLAFANEAAAEVVFHQPCAKVRLRLTTFSSAVVLRFFSRETVGASSVYTLVETRTLTQLQLLAPVEYDDDAKPVAKVEIAPVHADAAAVDALLAAIALAYRQLHEAGVPSAALAARARQLEAELARLREPGCRPGGPTMAALEEEILALLAQLEECGKELAALQAAQTKACKEASDFSHQLERCFPHAPSTLSYSVTGGGGQRFRFSVHDDRDDAVLWTSAGAYDDETAAARALFASFELARSPGSYALMNPRPRQYSFELADARRNVVAVSPAVLATLDDLRALVDEIQRTVQASGFAPVRRVGGKRPCHHCGGDLECWDEIPTADELDGGCLPAEVASAHDALCEHYDKVYRELYAKGRRRLAELTCRCAELTQGLAGKRNECRRLRQRLDAARLLRTYLRAYGPLRPPEGLPCSTLLHEVCWLSLDDHEVNLTIPGQAAIEQDYQAAVDAVEKRLTPIWRPHLKYAVRLQLMDTVNGTATPPRDFYFGFRTAGAVGRFHTDPAADYVVPPKTADQYMLTGLKGYVDYRRSYPDPSGNVIGAKPLFYQDARILLFFNRRYVYHFFGAWPAYNGLPALTDNAMQVVIKDPAEKTLLPNPPPPTVVTTEVPQAVVSWPRDDDPRIPEDVRALSNLRNPELLNPAFAGGECWTSGGEMITPASVYTQVIPRHLEPLKLYTAIVNGVDGGTASEVLSYGFQTSRYADFAAQIGSYRLDDGKGYQRDAVFEVKVPLTAADIQLMYDIVSGAPSSADAALAATWVDPFDRLVQGVLARPPLDAAVGTELNLVRNSTTNAVVAVWIRSPEPFNDPKLPDDVLRRSLQVMPGANPDPAYRVLFSRDRSQAIVMHPSRTVPVTQARFRFAYIEWDGFDYVDHAVVVTGWIPTH